MKAMKRVLCVTLTLVLGLGLLVPASAADADPTPIITVAPNFPNAAYAGDTLILGVEAVLPEGIEGELSYAWYSWPYHILEPIATGPELELLITNEMLEGYSRPTMKITVVVTNTYIDENGKEQTAEARLSSEYFELKLRMAWWEKALAVLIWGVPFLLYMILGLSAFFVFEPFASF
ncbi:MAG: hypothetical protein FWF05_04005 [Oscillospiraceae bacterium]|nr:hypothetical protein [Oscillospiraceae bacterium]